MADHKDPSRDDDGRREDPLEDDRLEAERFAAYPDPALQDRGETLALTGVAIGVVGVGVAAVASFCPPCMAGMVPMAAVAAPALVGAGAFKRWRRRLRRPPDTGG